MTPDNQFRMTTVTGQNRTESIVANFEVLVKAKFMHDKFFPCPCCESKIIEEPGTYEMCDICHWEDDPVQSGNPDYAGGANKDSLLDARSAWAKRDLTKAVF